MDSDRDLPCGRGCPIRRPADQRALAPPRSFSQRATSFIASWRQGIHQMPLPQRLIAKPVARRDKPRSQQVSHEDALLALEQLAPLCTEARSSSHSPGKPTSPHDGNAASQILPLHPVKDQRPCSELESPKQNAASPDHVARALVPCSAPGALGATRVAPVALATNARSAFARWWR